MLEIFSPCFRFESLGCWRLLFVILLLMVELDATQQLILLCFCLIALGTSQAFLFLFRWKINARKFKPILYVYYYAHGLSSVGPEVIRKVTFRSLNNVELVPIPGSCWHLSSLYNVASILDLCCPAEARMVQIMAFLRAVILSSSWMTVLYDSSLYLEAASMNLRLKSSSRPWQTL